MDERDLDGGDATCVLAAAAGSPPAASGDGGGRRLERGATIGRYLVVEQLGVGGMGAVYSAYDPELNRRVAIKVMRDEALGGSTATGGGGTRLLREAQALARLSDPNVIAVFDVGIVADQVFIAEELVSGTSLRAWLAAARRPRRQILEVFIQAGRGLAAAHGAGLIHRDFKPENVLVGADGRVRVVDFGLARAVSVADTPVAEAATPPPQSAEAGPAAPSPPETGSGSLLTSPLTQVGDVVGTPTYMAPEQYRGADVDPRTDQFSFCVALYEALYGERPFTGRSVRELAQAVVQGVVRPARREARVPPWLRRIVLRGLAARREERFAGMQELLVALSHDPATTRRRLLWLAAGAVVLLAGLGIQAYLHERRDLLCTGGAAKVAGVFGEEQRAAARRAFLATGLPYAQQAWSGVEGAVDTYAASWAAMHRDACEATRLRGEQSEELLDRRMQCLTERFTELAALAHVLGDADAQVVEKAVHAAHSLTPLLGCADVASLSSRLRPPKDEGTRAAVESVRQDLAKATALENAGKYKEGLELAKAAVAAATASGYEPVVAEARFRLGNLDADQGAHADAEADLYESLWSAKAAGYEELEARAANRLIYVVGYQEGQAKDGRRLARHARAAIAHLGDREDSLADWHTGLGLLEWDQGAFEPAFTHLTAALQSRERLLGPEDVEVGYAHNNLGIVCRRKGDDAGAVAHYNKTLAIWEKALGPMHPDVALVLNNLGNVASSHDDVDGAIAYFQRALHIREQTIGADHPRVAATLNNLGNALETKGDYDGALAAFERALAISIKAMGPEHTFVAGALNNVGFVLMGKGDLDGAEKHFRQALALLEKGFGPEHPDVGMALNDLGMLYRKRGQPDHALAYLRRALAIWEKAYGPTHADLAEPLTSIGLCYLDKKAPELALAPLERAETITAGDGAERAAAATTHFSLARALVAARGDRDRALALAERALAVYGHLRYQEKKAAEVESWLRQQRGG